MFSKKERKAETTDPIYDPDMIPADVFKYERREQRRPRWSAFDWRRFRDFDENFITYLILIAIVLLCMLIRGFWLY